MVHCLPAAAASDPWKWVKAEREQASKLLCHSTAEYIKTLKFLRSTHDFSFREKPSRMIADEVSRGCDGAAKRFSQVLLLLKSVGLSEKRSLEMALEFAHTNPEVQKNFVEIFTRAYLAEFLDYEYPRALRIAMDLSRDYKGDPRSLAPISSNWSVFAKIRRNWICQWRSARITPVSSRS